MSALKRLDVVRRRCDAADEPSEDDFTTAVREMNRRRQMEKGPAIAMVEFAQALAGTVMQEAAGAELDHPRAERPSRAPAPPPKPRRPDQHTEVSYEKAMACPWVNENGVDPNPKPAPRPPAGFEAWDPMIPSYDRDPGEEE